MSKPEPYKMEAHDFSFRQGGKLYCSHCGLMLLRNPFTDWAVRMGCQHKSHPQYASKRHDTTKLAF